MNIFYEYFFMTTRDTTAYVKIIGRCPTKVIVLHAVIAITVVDCQYIVSLKIISQRDVFSALYVSFQLHCLDG